MERKKIISIGVAASFLFVASIAFIPGQSVQAAQQGNPQKLCPVMGGEINQSIFVDYQGKRIYFCCAGCIDTFNQAPEKYIRAMETQGIRLDKASQAKAEPAQREGNANRKDSHSGMGHSGHMQNMGGKQ